MEPNTPISSIQVSKNPFDVAEIEMKVLPFEVDTKQEKDAVVRICVSEEAEEKNQKRTPVDVVTVIDVSGSMGSDATYEVDGKERSDGLTILDVCIHATKVIISCLRDDDRFSCVSFESYIKTEFPLSNMNEGNRKKANEKVETLRHSGGTNIWGGIKQGMDVLKGAKEDKTHSHRNKIIIVLTDGNPTTSPPGGIVNAYKDYCSKNEFECQLSCFGFGYGVASELCLDLAEVGGGSYAFIPTAPVLSTVFTNALASVLSTVTTHSKLILTIPKSVNACFIKKERKAGLNLNFQNRKTCEINLGPLLFGQTRDIVVPMIFHAEKKEGEFLEARLRYGQGKEIVANGKEYGYDEDSDVAILRAEMIDVCKNVVDVCVKGDLNKGKNLLKEFTKKIDDSEVAHNEIVTSFKKDVVGRVTKSLDGKARFNRWGKHYIRALLRAHAIQQCTNQLDFSVQMYGGVLFSILRKRGDEIFLKLPPPKPSKKVYTRSTSYSRSSKTTSYSSSSKTTSYRPPSPINTSNYTPGGGGCFGGESTVETKNGETIRIADVKKGEVLKVYGNKTAKVAGVMEFMSGDGKPLVSLKGGLLVTPKHPIRINGKWVKPVEHGNFVETGPVKLYNFVLEPANSILLVNGYQCVTLGHGLKGENVEHSYYGSKIIVDQLSKLEGWKNGKVNVEFKRDKDGHAIGIMESI